MPITAVRRGMMESCRQRTIPFSMSTSLSSPVFLRYVAILSVSTAPIFAYVLWADIAYAYMPFDMLWCHGFNFIVIVGMFVLSIQTEIF